MSATDPSSPSEPLPALRLASDEAPHPEHAGRTLVAPVVAGSQAAPLVWLGLALVATVVALSVHVLGLFAAMFSVAMAARSRPAEGEVVVGDDALVVTLDGAKRRFELPLEVPAGDTSAQPWRDPRGQVVHPHPTTFPPSVRAALQVRSAMPDASPLDRTIHEAIWMSDLSWRGRREGWVAVALEPDSDAVLGVFGDRESYEAALGQVPHRLFGVEARDSSGKGAQVGLPSDVEADLDPSRLHSRDEAYAS